MVRPASFDTGRSQRQQHLAGRTELDDDVAALVAFGNPVAGDGFGHPDISLAVHVEPVRPDEQTAAKGFRDPSVRPELHDGVGLRIAALVAESRRIFEALTADYSPDVLAVRIDDCLSDGAHRPSV